MKRLIFIIIALCAIGSGIWFWIAKSGDESQKADFITQNISRGQIQETIDATGTLEPEELIDVGAQVSGKILKFGNDANNREIDYGSTVSKGMVLATIDELLYQSDLDSAKAEVARSQANLDASKAELQDAINRAAQAKTDFERAEKLGTNAIAAIEYDQYKFAVQNADTAVAIRKAAIAQNEAALRQAITRQERAERDLSYCTIVSPVDGIIIDRKVNIGQTVVSSMSASSLFLIAKDLSKLQLWCAVNEADISNISKGQRVDFSVDTFPGRKFSGTVNKVRLNATMSSNVVTYIVEVDVDNKDNVLLPYLTANARFIVKESGDDLIVPNSALRWSPPDTPETANLVHPESRDVKLTPGQALVWIPVDGKAKAIAVTPGMSNAFQTIISSPDLKEGASVITGMSTPEAKSDEPASSPFMPKMPARSRNKSAGAPPRSN